MVNKEIIKKNFSKYAKYYDQYSTIQNLCGAKLISRVKRNKFRRILDIGCGTGNYTGFLRNKFPEAEIRAIDISEEMIRIAEKKLGNENIKFSIGDAEIINFKQRFDLISSNAALQWFGDLEKTLLNHKKLLNKGGIVLFSIFGPRTFYELNEALRKVFGAGARISARGFMEKSEIEKILGISFSKVKITQELFKERHISLTELLKKIKYTGTRGNAAVNNKVWTPKAISEIEKVYRKDYKSIAATYQVFFCEGYN